MVVMDANEVKQVFINIVTNALQAMPRGGTLTIQAGDAAEAEAAVSFTDTGVGIPEEHRAKIFEPFFSTKTEGSGTGLGLSISYRIVQQHGGRIEVESAVGRGSTFRVIFPRAAAAAGVRAGRRT
jgi:signal transduction histidine kinase